MICLRVYPHWASSVSVNVSVRLNTLGQWWHLGMGLVPILEHHHRLTLSAWCSTWCFAWHLMCHLTLDAQCGYALKESMSSLIKASFYKWSHFRLIRWIRWKRQNYLHMNQDPFTRVFFEMHKNGNNANIGIRGFISWKQKIPVTKCYPNKYWTTGPLIPSPTCSSLH